MMALQRNWREISLVPKGSRKIKEERMFCIFENLLATDNGKGCDDRQIDRFSSTSGKIKSIENGKLLIMLCILIS